MGKQVLICTTDEDNEAFRGFIANSYGCRFFQSFAKLKEQVFIAKFDETLNPQSKVSIHNQKFSWEPAYSQTSTREKLFYIENTANAPVVEFSKTNWENFEHGRIYWGKNFLGKPDYDLAAFEIFFRDIVNWVKKNAKGTTRYANSNIYFLENAWNRFKREPINKPRPFRVYP